jgi:hypothetical protein
MRRYDQMAAKKIVRNETIRSATAVVRSVDIDRVNITLGNTSTLVRGVEVAGDARRIAPGSIVPITWREGRPLVLQTTDTMPVLPVGQAAAEGARVYPNGAMLELDTSIWTTGQQPIYSMVSAQYVYGVVQGLNAAGDCIDMSFEIAAGTYMATYLGLTMNKYGIMQAYLDGVFQDEKDMYTSATTFNVTWSFPITILTDGVHKLRIQVSGKNASSSNYNIGGNRIAICKI